MVLNSKETEDMEWGASCVGVWKVCMVGDGPKLALLEKLRYQGPEIRPKKDYKIFKVLTEVLRDSPEVG